MEKIPEQKEDLLYELNVSINKRNPEIVKALKEEVETDNFSCYVVEDHEGTFSVRTTIGKIIATFSVKKLFGCCGVAVCFHSEVKYTKLGIGTILLNAKMEALQKLHFGLALATVLESNTAEKSLLVKRGWTLLKTFRNSNTGNLVGVYSSNL